MSRLILAAERAGQGKEGIYRLVDPTNATVGRLFVHQGRIAWCSVAGSSPLASPLIRALHESGQQLESILSAQEDAEGQELSLVERIARALGSPDRTFEDLLRRQLVFLVEELAQQGIACTARGLFRSLKTDSLQPRWSFGGCELFLEACSSSPELYVQAGCPPPVFSSLSATIPTAITFRRSFDERIGPLPIAGRGCENLSLKDSLEIFRGVQPMLAAPGFPDSAKPQALLTQVEGRGWLAVDEGEYLSVFRIDDEAQSTLAIIALLRHSRPFPS